MGDYICGTLWHVYAYSRQSHFSPQNIGIACFQRTSHIIHISDQIIEITSHQRVQLFIISSLAIDMHTALDHKSKMLTLPQLLASLQYRNDFHTLSEWNLNCWHLSSTETFSTHFRNEDAEIISPRLRDTHEIENKSEMTSVIWRIISRSERKSGYKTDKYKNSSTWTSRSTNIKQLDED